MLKNVSDLTNEDKHTGLNTQKNILGIDKSQSPNMMNVIVNIDGSLSKRLGSNTQNSTIITNSAGTTFNPAGTLTSQLIAYWKLDEPSGTRFDSYGTNILLDHNNVSQSGGKKNQAALFVKANSQHLSTETPSPLVSGDSDFTISTWVYINSKNTSEFQTIAAKRDIWEHPNQTVLLLHCNGVDASKTFTDDGPYTVSVTTVGNVQIDTAQSKFGGASALFDGAGDYLQLPDSDNWNFGAGDFTIDFWVRFNALPTAGSDASFYYQFQDTNNLLLLQYATSPSIPGLFLGIKSSNVWQVLLPEGSTANWATNTWYHVAAVRNGDNFSLYRDGVQLISTNNGTITIPDLSAVIDIGRNPFPDNPFFLNGWLDEYRVLKGKAAWTTNFTPSASQYPPTQYEYWLYLDNSSQVALRVSSSGIAYNGTVTATSFGVLDTATWYNVVAWHNTGNSIGVSVNLSENTASYASGIITGTAPFTLGSIDGNSNLFDGRIDETGYWKRVLTSTDLSNLYNGGSANTIQSAFDTKPWASFDFGASSIRWLMVSAGTGVYASSNLGVNFITIATDRSANYQYFERSKNVLIATSDSYDTPLYWAGSVSTYMAIVNSNAPLCKYSINFQGFLILLNSNTRKRGFFYQDENTQLTGTWASSFDIPSSADDEITAAFILRRYLYVSTRYYLYRLSYVGGNPDFSYTKIKDWGYVQRTVKYLYVEGVGQIVAGLCWDGKTRFFDGSDDQIFSNPIEQDNGLCEFSLSKINYSGSGPIVSFAETDYNENVYKLVLAIGSGSSQTTHMINYDGRSKAFYPYDRQHFNTMIMAESGNKRFLMAFDRSGYCHMLDSGNLDGNRTAIHDYYDSAILFEKSPAQSHKGHQTNLFFSNRTCGTITYLDRSDFDNEYVERTRFVISGSDKKFQIHQVIDCPENYNTYQWRIMSSAGTSDPWVLQRYDHFFKGQGIGKV